MMALDHERLFEPFLDEVDGVMCVPASARAADITRQAAPGGLRFPLLLEAESPLSTQIGASAFTPASSRFGPYCDNITGMNWELPDGRQVRVGERVVKSTTGYDLLRFLLGTGKRFGRPRDYVLRLRPACDGGGVIRLEGEPGSLERAAAAILHSSFLHWLESVDWMGGGEESAPWLRAGVHCPKAEWPVFEDFFFGLARQHGLTARITGGDGQVLDGCPDLAFKTTPERVIPLAREIAGRFPGARCVALCYCGVLHVHLPPDPEIAARVAAVAAPVAQSLHDLGGDWHSRHVERPVSCAEEAAWIETLTRKWGGTT